MIHGEVILYAALGSPICLDFVQLDTSKAAGSERQSLYQPTVADNLVRGPLLITPLALWKQKVQFQRGPKDNKLGNSWWWSGRNPCLLEWIRHGFPKKAFGWQMLALECSQRFNGKLQSLDDCADRTLKPTNDLFICVRDTDSHKPLSGHKKW